MKYHLTLCAILIALFSPAAWADTVDVIGGNGGWSSFETPGAAGATAFWNNTSWDGNGQCNIGYWLSGASGCSYANFYNGSPGVQPKYLGDGGTQWKVGKDASTASVTVTATNLQVTAFNNDDVLGWVDLTNPANPQYNVLFQGLGIPGTKVTFVPTGDYGFYISSPDGTYVSTGQGDSKTHIAVFQLPGVGHYMLGLEDMWVNGVFKPLAPDFDYNDAAFEIQFNGNTVPEPATMLLLGSGLVGIGAAARRRRKG